MNNVALALLLLSGVFVFYTYFGYGRALSLIARRCPNVADELPPTSDDDCPPLAVLICAFNEAHQITGKLDNCLGLDYPNGKLRIIVVSDGSTDETDERVRNYDDPRVSLISAPSRQGKAACINLGMEQIHEEIVLMADVRQELSANSARALVRHFSDPSVGAVTGKLQLQLSDGPGSERSYDRGVSQYWEHEVRLRQTEAVVHSVIGVTGAIYALRRSAFQPIPPGTILDDVLIPMNAVMDGFRVRFEARAMAFDHASTSPLQEQRRKIRTLAGNFQLLALRPELLNWRQNPVFWMFVSHKVMRLLVPVAMLVALVASVALYDTHWLFAACFWGQIAAYVASLVPERIFKTIAVGPIRSARTFVHMHWYVVKGFYEFVANRNAHIWNVSPSGKD
ncbi:MAG: glycosyltransferase family 2 protein [Hyphomicrobiaceae bacterium]